MHIRRQLWPVTTKEWNTQSSFESERPSRSRPVCHPGVTEHAIGGQNSVKSGGVAGRLECTARSWDNSFAELHFR